VRTQRLLLLQITSFCALDRERMYLRAAGRAPAAAVQFMLALPISFFSLPLSEQKVSVPPWCSGAAISSSGASGEAVLDAYSSISKCCSKEAGALPGCLPPSLPNPPLL
jgi:hypothetical protein